MQDMAAEALGMERGVSKLETGKQHLERNDYIMAKQKRELEESKKQAEKLTKENEQKALACEKLDRKSTTSRRKPIGRTAVPSSQDWPTLQVRVSMPNWNWKMKK